MKVGKTSLFFCSGMLLTWVKSSCIFMQKRWCMKLCDTISVQTEPPLEGW